MSPEIKKINPKYLIYLTVGIVLLMLGSAYFEITSSRKELLRLLDEEALSLVKTINASTENAILSGNEIEDLISANLINIGILLKDSETINLTKNSKVRELIELNEVKICMITDAAGNMRDQYGTANEKIRDSIKNLVFSYNLEKENYFIPGFFSEKDIDLYFVAVRRTNNKGYVFIGIDSKYFLDFRKKIGIGSLFRTLYDQKEIDYVVLQDYEGILAASKNIKELNSIQTDEFLHNAIEKDTTDSRIFYLNDREVYEAIHPLIIENVFYGLIRVGISMDSIREADVRLVRRIAIITLIIIGIGIVLFSLLLINQHKEMLHTEFRKLQSYNEKILENMTDGVLAFDTSGILLFINKSAEKILSLSGADATGKHAKEIISGSELLELLSIIEEVKAKEIVFDTYPRKILRISKSIALNSGDSLNSLIIILIQDITEERNLEAQIRRNEKMVALGELAGGVAHEVRNPLNAISIITQRLAIEFKPKEDEGAYISLIKTIRAEISRINKIVEQFLRFAKKPKLTLKREEIGLILINAIEIISSEAKNKGITIKQDIPQGKFAMLDRDQILQAMLNILKNSVEAITGKGIISVLLKESDKHYLIDIEDNGKGIAPENLSKIFNLYYTDKTNGTGIGLSLVNQIISEHEGRIEVESKKDKGTVFRIFLKKD